MCLSRTVSEVNGDFSRKSQILPMYLTPTMKRFHLELGIGARDQKTRVMWLPVRERTLISSAVSRLDSMHECDRQTDGRQQRPSYA